MSQSRSPGGGREGNSPPSSNQSKHTKWYERDLSLRRKGKERSQSPSEQQWMNASGSGRVGTIDGSLRGSEHSHYGSNAQQQAAQQQPDYSCMTTLRNVASGQVQPDHDCACAVCHINNPDPHRPTYPPVIPVENLEVQQQASQARSRTYRTQYFDGVGTPGTLTEGQNHEQHLAGMERAREREVYGSIAGSLAGSTTQNQIRIPTYRDSAEFGIQPPMHPQHNPVHERFSDIPPIPEELIRSLNTRGDPNISGTPTRRPRQ